MKTAGAKAKGRRLQVLTAEIIAREYSLTIEAHPPVPVGERQGVLYVREDENPDLRVRGSSEPGADVVLVTERARSCLCAPRGESFHIECKNVEEIGLGPKFWTGLGSAILDTAYNQALTSGREPLVVLSRNRWPVIGAVGRNVVEDHMLIYGMPDQLLVQTYVETKGDNKWMIMMPLVELVRWLAEMRAAEQRAALL